jgi:hypothetical protein
MAGKRKRQDASSEAEGEVEGHKVNGDNAATMQDRFHKWLLDILVILKE